MAAPRQGLPVRLERAPHRGAAFALVNASKRARIRSIGSRSRGSLFIFRSSPAVAPPFAFKGFIVHWLAFKGFVVHFSIIPRRRSPGPLVTVTVRRFLFFNQVYSGSARASGM